MDAQTGHPKFVVGVDGSAGGQLALRWAADEARLRHAALRVVHASGVLRLPPDLRHEVQADETARAVLDTALDVVGGANALGVELEAVVEAGDPALALTEVAKGAELLVVGSRGRGGFRGLLLGSVSLQCVQHAPCPVAVVRQPAENAEARVVVGVDGSEGADQALQWAAEEARLRRAILHVVHAWTFPYAGPHPGLGPAVPTPVAVENHAWDVIQSSLDRLGDRIGDVTVRRAVLAGSPGGMLVNAAADASLLVVGSRGRGGFAALLLGSVAQQCAHHAPCPLVVVRGVT